MSIALQLGQQAPDTVLAGVKSRVAAQLTRPRPLKPQTQRQLAQHLPSQTADLTSFLLCAADVLEDYELDILFGPVFTPTLDERAELADLLLQGPPSAEQLKQLVAELSAEIPHAMVLLPDGTPAKLTLHEVMVERFVRLLRLQCSPDAAAAALLRGALPADLWPLAVVLLCERGMTPERQAFFAAFVGHIRTQHPVSRPTLELAADFIASQPTLDRAALLAAADALLRATEGTAAYASSGHSYWSPDVAQHHQYRGQGWIDRDRVQQQQAELEHVAALVEDLRTFNAGSDADA